jgi:hypothetical protein
VGAGAAGPHSAGAERRARISEPGFKWSRQNGTYAWDVSAKPGEGERLAVMPLQASFGRKSTYRAYGINGDQLASEDLGTDEEAVAWVRRLVKDGLSVGRLSRDVTAGFGMDIPLP